jgi:diguanylate cyclase (GGDEF)-like protein
MLEDFCALKAEITASVDLQHKLDLAQRLHILAQDLSESERAEAALTLGRSLKDCDQFDAALETLETARMLYLNLGNPDGLAGVYYIIGYVKYAQGHYLQAMTFFRQALEQANTGGNTLIQAQVLNNISMVYSSLGDINNSLESQLKSLGLYRQAANGHGEATALSNLGVDYAALGEYEKALEFALQAQVIAEQLGIESLKAMILQGIGKYHLALNDDRAIGCLKQSCRMTHRSKDVRVMIEVMHELGRALMHQGRKDLAQRALRWAISLSSRSQRLHYEAEITYCLARLLLEHSDDESQTQTALGLLQDCLPKLEQVGDLSMVAKTYRLLSNAFEKTGQPDLAFEAVKTSLSFSDRQHEIEQQQRTLALTMQVSFNEATRQAELERSHRLELARLNEVLMRQSEELEREATHDALTALPNRRYLDRQLEEECVNIQNPETQLCVALADIDHFKKINDKFSHASGDAVLRVIAEIFRANMRGEDTVGRYGGEEFALIFPDTSKDVAEIILERLRKAVESYDWARIQPSLRVTVSIGLAQAEPHHNRIALMNIADTNLYVAKHAGRNRVIS